ncbi:type IV pilus assembly protein PilM [Candidatus Microgenomates bacterium]|nr:type IV pilus assembly protein PilM [Candidatus Microgenomates bacterium]
MKLKLFKTDSELLGIDIGTTGIRLVQVKHGGAEARLVTYGTVPLESSVLQSDAEIDKQAVVAAIRKLVADSKATAKNAVVGLPTSKVFASLVALPKMSPTELAKSIQYQAEQHVPMALDQVKLDWMVVGESSDGKQQEVMLVAAPNSLAERYLAIMEASGLDVVAIEPDAIALCRALTNPSDQAVVVLDVGSNSTDLVMVQQGNPKLIRSIPVGGETFVKATAQNLNLEPDQAFQFVYKFGLAQSKMEGQVQKALKASVDNLVSELDKSIQFFLNRYKDNRVVKVVLTGKASVVPDLPLYIANGVNLPVEIGNSWIKIMTPADLQTQLMELSNQFAVACGLALREGGHE